jgi:Clp amino terminal domain, pathogenicity island component/ClpX C4-type zinc finger
VVTTLAGWDPCDVFERFTDRARRVLVLAQEEASLLRHGFIGTEHILLGLIHEGDGVAAQALEELGISLEGVRRKVEDMIGTTVTGETGAAPFTPRAKKVLELSLREALQLGHTYIGTEHILLGLVREGEGVAAQVLISSGVELASVRQQVVRLLSGSQGEQSVGSSDEGPRAARLAGIVACSFCGRRPPETGQLVSGRRGAYVCERCVDELHTRFAADDEDEAGGDTKPEVITGRVPDDEDGARAEITLAFGHVLVLSEDRRTVPSVEGGELLGPCLKEAHVRHAALRHQDHTVTVERIQFVDETHAAVSFTVALEGVSPEPRTGDALVVDATWKVARSTFCALMSLAGVQCPPMP